jgi:hypothetical protein
MLSALANVVPGVTILTTVPEVSADTALGSLPCTVVCIASKPKCHESCIADLRSKESESESLPLAKRLFDRMAAREAVGLSSLSSSLSKSTVITGQLWFGGYYFLRVG